MLLICFEVLWPSQLFYGHLKPVSCSWARSWVGLDLLKWLTSTKCTYFRRGAIVDWIERLAVVLKVAGLSPARAKDWKTLTVHPVVNRYPINVSEG